MKKTNTKLQLKTATVRLLQASELAEVHGGDDGARRRPSDHPTQCSASVHCDPPGGDNP